MQRSDNVGPKHRYRYPYEIQLNGAELLLAQANRERGCTSQKERSLNRSGCRTFILR